VPTLFRLKDGGSSFILNASKQLRHMLLHPKTPQQLLTKFSLETQPLSSAVRYRGSADQSKENASPHNT